MTVHVLRVAWIIGAILDSVGKESDDNKAQKRGPMNLAFVPAPLNAEHLKGVLDCGKILPKCGSPGGLSG